jgi:hypothetical protein
MANVERGAWLDGALVIAEHRRQKSSESLVGHSIALNRALVFGAPGIVNVIRWICKYKINPFGTHESIDVRSLGRVSAHHAMLSE